MQVNAAGKTAARRVTCARCGAAFDCCLSGDCWCDAEPYRLPMPATDEDCICPICLHAAAKAQAGAGETAR